jgi:uncharacterized protein YjbI with pentapeptide repeats
MADAEQLKLLKQGVAIWNRWRKENPNTIIDLSKADLVTVKLSQADFRGANLTNATFRESVLAGVDFDEADLWGATFRDANLSRANFWSADLRVADFIHSDLSNAILVGANLSGAYLHATKMSSAIFGSTTIGSTDLSKIMGLEEVIHQEKSILGHETLSISKGQIPEVFLRGCGLSDWEIESAKLYNPDLSNHEIDKILYKIHDLRATQPLQISPLFISYSHADNAFVDKIEGHLNAKGIRFWRDVHHATAGRLEKQIDRAIRHNPTVLVILSENSIKSDWVEHEVRTVRELEKETGRDVLCPVALDDGWKESPWPKRVMEQVMEYNILDFSRWEDDGEFEKLFKKLIDGLELFYK